MVTRKLHRIAGIVMLLPLVGWAVTGAVFFVKPGYSSAFETLQVKTYPFDTEFRLVPDAAWLEVRLIKTIVGEHLLARTANGWLHYNPRDLTLRTEPAPDQVRALVNDAISSSSNQARYGHIINVQGGNVATDTGVSIEIDWDRLAFSQRGPDTDRIDTLYRIHYLQWTGMKSVDRILGMLGIVLVLALSVLGARLFFLRA